MATNAENLPEAEVRKEPQPLEVTVGVPLEADESMPADEAPVKYPWWREGDAEAFATVLSDNLATIVVMVATLLSFQFAPVTVFGKIMPGIGLSIMVGNFYYSWQALRLARSENRVDVTAQPYGINTPGAFVFLFSILGAVSSIEKGKGATPAEAGETAYRVAVLANLISGGMELLGAVVGPWMLRNIPFSALTAPLAGVGLAYLALDHLLEVFRYGMVGLLPLFIMMTSYFGGMRFKYFPAVWVALLLSTAIAWVGRYKHQDEVSDAWRHMTEDRWERFGDFPFAHISKSEASYATDYMSLIIPVSITNFMSTMEVVSSAHLAGDCFNVAETMAIDGIGTMIGALFGSPFGTTVYIGHPVYKRMGGSRGYSILNGIVLFILCFTGAAGLLMSVLAREGLLVVIIFVGLALAQQTIEHTPIRQYPTVLLGFLPIFAEWGSKKAFNIAGIDIDSAGWRGWWYFSQGAMLISLALTVTLYFAINRQFIKSAVSAGVSALAAMIGLIHHDKIYGPSDDIHNAKYDWFFAWMMVAGYCLVLYVAQRFFKWIDEPIEEVCFHARPYTDGEGSHEGQRESKPVANEPVEE